MTTNDSSSTNSALNKEISKIKVFGSGQRRIEAINIGDLNLGSLFSEEI